MYDRNSGCGDEHNAPWMEVDVVDDDGEEVTVCDCTICRGRRIKEQRAEAQIDDYEYKRGG